MSRKLAIDFGTTNSLVACMQAGEDTVEFICLPGLSMEPQAGRPPLAPSLLYIQDGRKGDAALGQSVLDQKLYLRKDNRFFRSFKRGILAGTVSEPRLIDGVPWSDNDAGRRFLRGLFEALPFPVGEIDQLVVTAPVGAFEGYLTWISDGVRALAPEVIRMVDESTAAALGYSVTEPGAVVLVFDFGGGSLDLSLVQLPESREKTGGWLQHLRNKAARQHTARVISKVGLNLGGSDVDQWLLNAVLQRVGRSIQDLGKDYPALLTACEQAKIALSEDEASELVFEIDQASYSVTYTRQELEELLHSNGFYDTIRRSLDKVMHVAQRQGIFAEDLHYVLMVGGASLMPSVQETLRAYFKTGAVRVEKPFTAIAEGALGLAAGVGLDDYLVHSYGLRYLDSKSGQHAFDEIIPMGSRYPGEKPFELTLAAAYPGQAEVEFIIGEIEDDSVSLVEVQYEDGQAVFVARAAADAQQIMLLNPDQPALVKLQPPGEPGEDRLRARFSVDAQRQLHLNVFDLKTRRETLKDGIVAHLAGGKADNVCGLSGREPGLSQLHSPVGRRLSLRGLGTLLNMLPPDAISLDAAAEALRSDEFYVRFAAASLLGRRGDRDARRLMQDVLDNGAAPQRASVAHHLHHFTWYVAEPMLRQALSDPDLRVGESAVYSLCQLRGPDAYRLLVEALTGAEDRLRMAAAWGLSRNPDAGSVPVLEVLMLARDPEIRVKALESLGATQAAPAAPIVRRSLDDSDLDVLYAAVLSWIELEGESCLPELAGRVERSRGELCARLALALFHATNYLFMDIGDSPLAECVIAALETALHDEHPETRQTAAMPLAWIRHPRAATALRQAYLHEPDGAVKTRMLFTAVHLMSPLAKELLQDALASQDQGLCQAAEYISRTYRL